MDPSEVVTHLGAFNQRLDALSQMVSNLSTENQTLKSYVTDNFPIRVTHPDTPEPKISPPDIFSGDRRNYREYINACKLLFDMKPQTYATDRTKVCTAISYLRGEPRAWANTFIEKEDPILNSFSDFRAAMDLLYDDPSKQISAESALRAL